MGCSSQRPTAEISSYENPVTTQMQYSLHFPGQSEHAADKVLDDLLLEMGAIEDLKEERRKHEKVLKSRKTSDADMEAASKRIIAIERELETATAKVTELHETLGTEQCRKLADMRGDPYLRARVNARALRANVRFALQAHKFESRKLERAYRHQLLRAFQAMRSDTCMRPCAAPDFGFRGQGSCADEGSRSSPPSKHQRAGEEV